MPKPYPQGAHPQVFFWLLVFHFLCLLFRSKQIESACFSGTAAFMEVRIQSVVVEFILNHVDVLFSSKLSSVIRDGAGEWLPPGAAP